MYKNNKKKEQPIIRHDQSKEISQVLINPPKAFQAQLTFVLKFWRPCILNIKQFRKHGFEVTLEFFLAIAPETLPPFAAISIYLELSIESIFSKTFSASLML